MATNVPQPLNTRANRSGRCQADLAAVGGGDRFDGGQQFGGEEACEAVGGVVELVRAVVAQHCAVGGCDYSGLEVDADGGWHRAGGRKRVDYRGRVAQFAVEAEVEGCGAVGRVCVGHGDGERVLSAGEYARGTQGVGDGYVLG